MAGVVAAVADDNESLFLPAAVLQMFEPLTHSIVERRSSARGDGCKGMLELLCVVGKRLPFHNFNGDIIVKVHDEHFILWITGMREGGHGGNDIRQLGTHTSAVVDDVTHGNRCVSVFKYSQILERAVLVDAEILELETGDESSARVGHLHRQHDEIGGHRNFRLSVDAN